MVLIPSETDTTGDDIPHPIANVGEVPLSHVGQKGKLMNVLHVPTITKNWSRSDRSSTKGWRSGLHTSGASLRKKVVLLHKGIETDIAMFAKGQKVESDINL